MIIVNLKGGLGNQMFQYALAYSLAKKNKTQIAIDLRYLNERKGQKNYVNRDYDLGIFGIPAMEASKSDLLKVGMVFGNYRVRYLLGKVFDLFGLRVLSERTAAYEDRVLNKESNYLYLDGYWQSEKYFLNHEKEIKKLFSFNNSNFDEKVKELCGKIVKDKYAVCLNVRRGDFVGSKIHDVVNLSYYENAIKILKEKFNENLNFYIFSDDPDWCKKNLSNISDNVEIIGHEFAGQSFSAYLYLMTNFKKYIIPNSTFAWWAAWLANSEEKYIIAPKIWSNHLKNNPSILPKDWKYI